LRFPAEVSVVAVRWYLRYGLSYRDVEELLVERGVEVDHVTVFRWVQRFTPLLVDAARFGRHSPGDRWFADETYVKINGVWRYVYRAVERSDHVPDPGSPRSSPRQRNGGVSHPPLGSRRLVAVGGGAPESAHPWRRRRGELAQRL
jgi:hypothetical protein